MAKKPTKGASKPSTPTYPVNPALEAAVIANAEDDTPRLVYADWLDENGDPDRAAFIRTQVVLWDKNPADPDYVDLLERQEELELLEVNRRIRPTLPPELGWLYYDPEQIQRGFPFIAGFMAQEPGGPTRTERDRVLHFREKFPALLQNATIRGLRCYGLYSGNLDVILDCPESNKLAALLIVNHSSDRIPPASAVEMILNSAATNLQWLGVDVVQQHDAILIAGAKSLPPLIRFQGSFDYCSDEALAGILASDWFRGLHRVEVSSPEWSAGALITALAGLPELHTIESPLHSEAIELLPRVGSFRSLGRLRTGATLRDGGAKRLAKAKMPRLAVLELCESDMLDEDVLALTRSSIFRNLRFLHLDALVGDNAIQALAESESASQLRYLTLKNSTFENKGLQLLATAFPNLTTLKVAAPQWSGSIREVTRVLAEISSPLRTLFLPFPISDTMVAKIAHNPAFNQLRILNLGKMAEFAKQPFTHKGLTTLLTSKNLSNLTHLTVGEVDLQKALPLLQDSSILPNLRVLQIGVSAKIGSGVEYPRAGLTVYCLTSLEFYTP